MREGQNTATIERDVKRPVKRDAHIERLRTATEQSIAEQLDQLTRKSA